MTIRDTLSKSISKRVANVLGIGLMALAPSAFAAISWTFTGCVNGAAAGATCVKTASGITATAQAWSNTKNNSANTVYDYAMETAYLRQYSGGLGVTNQDGVTTAAPCATGKDCAEADGLSPEHAVDNQQRYDSVLFTFSDAIKLTNVTLGFPSGTSYDSDITVLAYNPALPGAPALLGQTFSAMVSAGWKLAGSYGNVSAAPLNGTVALNTATTTYPLVSASKYWLLAAYNPIFGPTAGLDAGNDYVKFLTIAGTPQGKTPEPHVLLLLGIGALAGFWNHRKRMRAG